MTAFSRSSYFAGLILLDGNVLEQWVQDHLSWLFTYTYHKGEATLSMWVEFQDSDVVPVRVDASTIYAMEDEVAALTRVFDEIESMDWCTFMRLYPEHRIKASFTAVKFSRLYNCAASEVYLKQAKAFTCGLIARNVKRDRDYYFTEEGTGVH